MFYALRCIKYVSLLRYATYVTCNSFFFIYCVLWFYFKVVVSLCLAQNQIYEHFVISSVYQFLRFFCFWLYEASYTTNTWVWTTVLLMSSTGSRSLVTTRCSHPDRSEHWSSKEVRLPWFHPVHMSHTIVPILGLADTMRLGSRFLVSVYIYTCVD